MLACQGQGQVPQSGIDKGCLLGPALRMMQGQQTQQGIGRRGGMAAVTLEQGNRQLQPLLIANAIAQPGRIHKGQQVIGETVAPSQHAGWPIDGPPGRTGGA